MEKDSFDIEIQKIIAHSDQDVKYNSGKEKVWNAIQKNHQPKKWRWYAAAAILVLSLSGIIFSIKDKPEIKIVKADIKPRTETTQKKVEPIITNITQRTIQIKRIRSAQMPIKDDTLNIEDKVILPIALLQETKLTTIKAPPSIEIVTTIKKDLQPEFTVQFKRGKPLQTAAELQIKETMALTKLKFGRDTSAFTSSNIKQTNPLKIKF